MTGVGTEAASNGQNRRMAGEHEVQFTRGSPETVLPPPEPEVAAALASLRELAPAQRREGARQLAVRWPGCLDAWAALAELAEDEVDRYAYARVGYHRGLDALRAAGWRGSGLVRWEHPENRGFLRSLAALGAAAATLGEEDEATRCALFLRQLDPGWDRRAD